MEQHPIKINKVQIRNLQLKTMHSYPNRLPVFYSDGSDVFWTHAQIKKLISIFPEGQIVTVVDDKIVGCALSIIVDYDKVRTIIRMHKLRVRKHSILIIRKETSCTVLRYLFIRIPRFAPGSSYV